MKSLRLTKNMLWTLFISQIFSINIQAVELLQDRTFSKGLTVKSPKLIRINTPGTFIIGNTTCQNYKDTWTGETHNLYFQNKQNSNNVAPIWQMSQWDSKSDLYPKSGRDINSGAFIWENWYKSIILGKLGSGYRYLTLGVNGSREFRGVWGNKPNVCMESPHPHLLISQSFGQHNSPRIGELKRFQLLLTAKVNRNYITPEREEQWDRNLYTAHFKIHINFQNIRSDRDKTKGHGQSFGVGINFFDVRNRDQDYHSRIFIHKPFRRVMLDLSIDSLGENIRQKLHSGGWATLDKNILPDIQKAFKEAIRIGKSHSAVDPFISESLNDYIMTDFNFGWEVSSLHDVEMHISDISIDVD